MNRSNASRWELSSEGGDERLAFEVISPKSVVPVRDFHPDFVFRISSACIYANQLWYNTIGDTDNAPL